MGQLSASKKGEFIDLGDRLGDVIEDGFSAYGRFVARHPGKIIILSLLFTLINLPGLAFVRINLDLYKLFVPSTAPVRFEFESQKAFDLLPLGSLEDSSPKILSKTTTMNPSLSITTDIGNLNLNSENLPAASRFVETIISEDAVIFDSNNTITDQVNITHILSKKDTNSTNPTTPNPTEISKIDGHLPIHNDILRFYIVHENYENLLVSETLGKLYDYTNEMMLTTMDYEGRRWTLEDFCKKPATQAKCTNELNVWLKHAENLFKNNRSRINPNLQLSYPVMYLFNRPKDIGNIIYGVDIQGEKHEITGAKVLTIHWFIAFLAIGNNHAAYIQYREKLNEFWALKTKESNIKFIAHNDKAMDDELLLIIKTALPFAVPALLQLMLFLYATNLSNDVRKSKQWEAFFGVIGVVLGLLTTFGTCFYFGLPFNPVSSTMPFLILVVGVDDAFLMLGAWRTSDPRLSVERRMGIMMGDAGASITVTSLTDFGCFVLGYFLSPTPAVADFCIMTALGVFYDYMYQITFFAAIMVYSGHREKYGGIKTYFCCYKTSDFVEDSPEEEERKAIKSYNEPMFMHRFLEQTYAPFILRPKVKLISWAIYVIFVCVSFYGCSKMRVDISPKKYIRDNSPIQTFVHLADIYIWADNVMPTIHVMRPPDFRNASQRARFNEMIFRLENTKYSIGRVSTNFWVWEYQNFLNDFPEVKYENDFYKRFYLRNFFTQFDYQQLRPSVRFNSSTPDGEPNIIAFTFQTSFYGLNSWDKRQVELFHWRRILEEFPEFEAFLAGIFSPFLIDQRRTIAPASMQSVGSAIVVMTLISIFFLPDKQSVFIMSFSLISISMGVCGFLSIWGSDLDSVSMGCIIMAIGLAVDFSIHICYRYHRSTAISADAKVIETLSIVGYPILQAGCSTLWGMLTLPLVPAYLVRVFFQTVVLVSIFGLAHGLIWLPQFISALDPVERIPRRIKHPHGE